MRALRMNYASILQGARNYRLMKKEGRGFYRALILRLQDRSRWNGMHVTEHI